jgi:nucleotide-binding universal stress UspA family protein/hemerythrin-like domain-containing protein
MYTHLLVPLDGSTLSIGLVTQAVDFARSLAARITFFTAREDLGASGDGALLRSLEPQDYAEAAAGSASAILAKAVAAAGAFGIPCEAVARTGPRPYELILDVAAEQGCDLIFMASHGRKGLKAMVLGSQTHKVLAHSTLPVLVASVESNAAGSAAEAAIGIIKDEHRAIAAVIRGLRQVAAELRSAAPLPDLDFPAGLVAYLKTFPEVLHHPKEEQFLFARLAARSAESAELIARLEAEHREGSAQIQTIEACLSATRSDPARYGDLADAIDRFADAQWQHLSTEEKLILPAARQHLDDTDWQGIASAFQQNAGVRVGSEQDEAFKRMFVRLMNRASA